MGILPLPTWLPFALAMLLFVPFMWRSLWVMKKTGENPNKLGFDDSPMGLCARSYRNYSMIITSYLIVRIVHPEFDSLMGPITLFHHDFIALAGLALAIAGVLFAIYAQLHMATSWRIGIPHDKPGNLVTTGPFAISRNPYFLGSMIFYYGIFFMVPNALTLMVTTCLSLTMNMQARLEEEFLTRTLGDPYKIYKARVRRWL